MGGLVRGYKQHLTVPHPGWQRTDPLDRGLVGEWRFDPATGLVVPDYSGYGLHSSAVTGAPPPTWVGTRYGPGLQCVAANSQSVTIDDAPVLNLTTLTVEWFGLIGNGIVNTGLISKRGAVIDWTLHLRHNSTIRASTVGGFITTAGTWSDGDFHHVVVVFNGANSFIYVDGNEEVSGNAGAITPTADPVAIGRVANAQYLEGVLLLARIYNRVPSAAEAQARYELCLKRNQAMTHVWMIPWGMVTAVPRIPRIPAAYNTLAIY